MLKSTGPYMLLQKLTPTSYEIRQLLLTEGTGHPINPIKVNTICMERLTSILCIKKFLDGTGETFLGLDGPKNPNLLENVLGFHCFGTYKYQ